MGPAARPESEDEDVWASDGGSHEGADSLHDLERERLAREQHLYNSGYREGIETGKEVTLQQGFNLGFSEGAQAGLRWGCAKAAVKTLAITCGQVPGTTAWDPQIKDLTSRLEGIKDREAMLGALKQVLAQSLTTEQVTQGRPLSEDPDMVSELAAAWAQAPARLLAEHAAGGQQQQGTNLPDVDAHVDAVGRTLADLSSHLAGCIPARSTPDAIV